MKKIKKKYMLIQFSDGSSINATCLYIRGEVLLEYDLKFCTTYLLRNKNTLNGLDVKSNFSVERLVKQS